MQFKNLDQNALSSSELAVQAQAVLDADNYAEMSAFAADILGATGIKPVGTPKSEVKSALSIFIDKYLDANIDIDGDDATDTVGVTDTDTVEVIPPAGVEYPIATEYMSGNNAVIFQNSETVFSDGIQEWSKDQFDMAVQFNLLTKVEAVKKTAIVKPLEIKPKRYFVKVSNMPTVSFEDMDQALERDDMTLPELAEYLNRLGQDDARMALSELRFSLASKGSRKSIASRSNGGGGGQGVYIASSLDNLGKLSEVQQRFLNDCHNDQTNGGVTKTKASANKYGFFESVSDKTGETILAVTKLNNFALGLKKMGWALSGKDGVWSIDYPNMPENWEIRLTEEPAR